MIRLSKEEKQRLKCHSSKQDRKWLDRLEKCRCDMAPLIMSTNGCIYKLLRRRWGGSAFGAYCINMQWVKQEVRRREKEHHKEQQKEIQNHIGAFI